MNRFLLFCGDAYYPIGGFNDFHSQSGSIDEIKLSHDEIKDKDSESWAHIFDLESGCITHVYDGESDSWQSVSNVVRDCTIELIKEKPEPFGVGSFVAVDTRCDQDLPETITEGKRDITVTINYPDSMKVKLNESLDWLMISTFRTSDN